MPSDTKLNDIGGSSVDALTGSPEFSVFGRAGRLSQKSRDSGCRRDLAKELHIVMIVRWTTICCIFNVKFEIELTIYSLDTRGTDKKEMI